MGRNISQKAIERIKISQDLRKEGKTVRQISEITGISKTQIHRDLGQDIDFLVSYKEKKQSNLKYFCRICGHRTAHARYCYSCSVQLRVDRNDFTKELAKVSWGKKEQLQLARYYYDGSYLCGYCGRSIPPVRDMYELCLLGSRKLTGKGCGNKSGYKRLTDTLYIPENADEEETEKLIKKHLENLTQ